jgi:hypothetical protein
MKFTVEVLSGFYNVLKSFITALSIGETNILPRVNHCFLKTVVEIFFSKGT